MLTRRTLISSMVLAIGTRPSLAEPTTHHVDIMGFQFTPKLLTVSSGDRVVFTNRDVVPHTASAVDGSWGSVDLSNGAQWSLEVVRRGNLDYYCQHHPVMRGTLISS